MQWTITQLDCYPDVDGEKDVVVVAHWTVSNTVEGYTGSAYGTAALKLDPSAPFTPYDQLTETQVVGWVKAALGPEIVGGTEAAVNRQIEDKKNPPIVTPPLPW